MESFMSNVLAGYLPGGLTAIALDAWKKQKVEGLEPDPAALVDDIAASLTPEQVDEGDREMQATSLAIQESCVIPLLSRLSPDEVEFTAEWRAHAIKGLKQKDPKFDESSFEPKDYVIHPQDLDGKDSAFLYQWARGLAGTTPIKGGNVANMSDVVRFRKKPARSSRVKSDERAVQQVS